MCRRRCWIPDFSLPTCVPSISDERCLRARQLQDVFSTKPDCCDSMTKSGVWNATKTAQVSTVPHCCRLGAAGPVAASLPGPQMVNQNGQHLAFKQAARGQPNPPAPLRQSAGRLRPAKRLLQVLPAQQAQAHLRHGRDRPRDWPGLHRAGAGGVRHAGDLLHQPAGRR
jgi:hypothetical protein